MALNISCLVLLVALIAAAPPGARAAPAHAALRLQLPLHLQWVVSALPDPVLPAFSAHAAALARLAARPRTPGGAAALLAPAGNATAAAALQAGVCRVFLEPPWPLSGVAAPKKAAAAQQAAAPGGEGGGGDDYLGSKITALGDAKVQKAEALLPPPARPLARALLESLPAALCAAGPAAAVGLPARWKDAVCPLGLTAAPLQGAAGGFKPWGVVAAGVAFGASFKVYDNGIVQPGLMSISDENATTSYIVHPGPGDAVGVTGTAGDGGQELVTGDPQAALAAALAADLRYAAARNQMACNASLELTLTRPGSALDPVVQITQLLAAAPPPAADAALSRVDARRFGSAAALAAALGALPPAARAAQAARLRRWLEAVPGRVCGAAPAVGVITCGWLTPFVCRVELKDFESGGGNGTTFWTGLNPVALAVRSALRLDEPAALMAALVGGRSGSAAMRAACAAIWDASEAARLLLAKPFDLEFRNWRPCIARGECGP
ncbi:MAG: hypothetical protein J3K34DRAFT_524676 [Monoraphidium minutum]|nr:MAG: hypothetical protein J3K34DRAFT_524676 [Monoraphidium minutum]